MMPPAMLTTRRIFRARWQQWVHARKRHCGLGCLRVIGPSDRGPFLLQAAGANLLSALLLKAQGGGAEADLLKQLEALQAAGQPGAQVPLFAYDALVSGLAGTLMWSCAWICFSPCVQQADVCQRRIYTATPPN